MIVVDLEMSGLYPERCGIFEIGAVDLETGDEFFDECRIDDDEVVKQDALRVVGKTEEQLRDKGRQSQKELLEKFFAWVESRKVKSIVCQNFMDTNFLEQKARKFALKVPFGWRTFDLHSVGHLKYQQVKGEFLINRGLSSFGLSSLLTFVGMEDPRAKHNALEDAKLEAECFSRVVYGKSFFKEFEEFEIPEYLNQGGK